MNKRFTIGESHFETKDCLCQGMNTNQNNGLLKVSLLLLWKVVETATFSETELNEYCRTKGLYPQQIKDWKLACISGADHASQLVRDGNKQMQQERKRIQILEKELRRKDKALAETAALLVLSKKLDAFYGINNEDN